MMFAVSLIKTKPIHDLTGLEVFDLCSNATHIAGQYWMFEGEEDALLADVAVVADGVTEGLDTDLSSEIVEHCSEIFNFDFAGHPVSYEILA